MIPQIVHRIWLGTGRLPERSAFYLRQFRRLHPRWTHFLWTDHNLPDLVNKREFDAEDCLSVRSDILRFELLFRLGGVYLDTDVECRRCLEPLFEQPGLVFLAEENPGHFGTAFQASAPGHPLYRDLVAGVGQRWHGSPHLDPSNKLGPGYLQETIGNGSYAGLCVLPTSWIYPFGWWEKERAFEAFPDAYLVHHWQHSWLE